MASHFDLPLAHEDLEPVTSEKIAKPFQRFMAMSTSGGIVLLVCTVIALVWANSKAFGESYHDIFHTYLKLEFGSFILKHSLVHWINDALMAIFFLLVGLEIKRELLVGELSSLKRAALPAFAAIGGMVVPAALYAAVNMGANGSPQGWGVPMATDIAFALGILALVGNRVPNSIRIFLTSLAIVDDLGALLVIAIFYTENIAWSYLGYGGAILALLFFFNRIGMKGAIWYILPGIALWYCFLESGVHATIAGVLVAATIPVVSRVDGDRYLKSSRNALNIFETSGEHGSDIRTNSAQRAAVMSVNDNGKLALPLLHRMEHSLHPWVAFLIIPIFALSNAGVHVEGSLGSALTGNISLGIMLGLILGKPLGVVAAALISTKLGLASLPSGTTVKHLIGVGCLSGIGFTMALFIGNLGFAPGADGSTTDLDHAKVGILAASTISAILGIGILMTCKKSTDSDH